MVSTSLSYTLINRDMKASLSRVAQQGMVERQTAYYKDNIGKVKTVDEFLGNYQLYSYAMDAYGLSEMTYAKAFMKKVLESDLNDQNSFANKLTDERYRDFAAAFNFSAGTATVQTSGQFEKMEDLYTSTIDNLDSNLKEETRYYKAMIGQVTSVDQLLRNDRLRAYVFKVFDIDEKSYSYAHIRGLLTSDVKDDNTYLNVNYGAAYKDASAKIELKSNIERYPVATSRLDDINTALANPALSPQTRTNLEAEKTDLTTEIAKLNSTLPPQSQWKGIVDAINPEYSKLVTTANQYNQMAQLAAAFEFRADGTVDAGQAQTTANVDTMINAYAARSPRVTPTVAILNKEYFEKRISEARSVDDLNLATDTRLKNYIVTAFNMNSNITVAATIELILTSDVNNPQSSLNRDYGGKEPYLSLRKAFNFKPDGSLDPGVDAQTADQTKKTNDGYMIHYNDKDDAADQTALGLFKSAIKDINSVSTFLSKSAVFSYALKAVGLDPSTETPNKMRQILTSDLQDPKSYVYTLKDDRYVKLDGLFNFKTDGTLGVPVLAQSELEIQSMSADYIKVKSAFGKKDDKTKAQDEAKYYAAEVQKVKTLDDLLGNKRLINLAMESLGIDPESVKPEKLKEIFKSNLDDPKSAVNMEPGTAFRRLVTAFNFGTDGKILREDRSQVQNRRGLTETLDNYLQQSLETQAGEDNPGVRLALYFERTAKSATSYYTILADTALKEFVNTTFDVPDELGNAEVDSQVAMMKKYFDIQDFQNPDKLKKLIARFTVMYDLKNSSTGDPILTLFNGSAASGISGDTLLAVATLRAR